MVEHSGSHLIEQASPGAYELHISIDQMLAIPSAHILLNSAFCVRYELAFDIRPLNMLRDHHDCWQHMPLPLNWNTGETHVTRITISISLYISLVWCDWNGS